MIEILGLLYLCVFDTPLTSATTYNLALSKPTTSDSVFSSNTPTSAVVDGFVTYCESNRALKRAIKIIIINFFPQMKTSYHG